MSRITDTFGPDATERMPWQLSPDLSLMIGHILDDRFDQAHTPIYEHERLSFAECRYHPLPATPLGRTAESPSEGLAEAEWEFRSVLLTNEENRHLRIVGDVGVGKSTFLQHLIHHHFPTSEFCHTRGIYLDWRTFTASVADPLPEIRRRFYQDTLHTLEQLQERGALRAEELTAADYAIIESSRLCAAQRASLAQMNAQQRVAAKSAMLIKLIDEHPFDYTVARLNALCGADVNRFVVIIDNVDQLQTGVLQSLLRFVAELRQALKCLVVLAVRDHTSEHKSVYDVDAVMPAWSMRLYPPSIGKLLRRRLEHFIPTIGEARFERIKVKSAPQVARICHALLQSPLATPETLSFISAWSNYSIRDLFRTLQHILSFHGLKTRGNRLGLSPEPFALSVDDVLVALGMRGHTLFYPTRSSLLNMYSAGEDTQPTDRLIGARLLQYLQPHSIPQKYANIRDKFASWGYSSGGIERQTMAMIRKDVIWSNCGDPDHFNPDHSFIRLSYRGELYPKKLMSRATYNYMMAFNVSIPEEARNFVTAPFLKREYWSELEAETSTFADLEAALDVDAISRRVLGLADVIAHSELQEVEHLRATGKYDAFRSESASYSCSAAVLDGLQRFISAAADRQGTSTRRRGLVSAETRDALEVLARRVDAQVRPLFTMRPSPLPERS